MAIAYPQLIPHQHMQASVRRREALFGRLLLILAFAVSLTQLYWGNFVDEADNLAAGWFIAKGAVLYRDVFSHHFPFPYYWVALVFTLFGPSIAAIRLSLLLFHILTLWIAMRLSRFYISIGLMALVWSLIGAFYFGNLIIFHNFKGVCLFAIFVTAFASSYNRLELKPGGYLVLGGFATIALFSDPLSIYAIGLASLILFHKNISWTKVVCLALPSIVTALLFVGYEYLSGTWGYFWDDAILFNKEHYSQYITVDLFPLKSMIEVAKQYLHLFDARWKDTDLLRTMDPNILPVDRWLFTGFLYRFAIVTGTLILLFRLRVLTALFLYFYTATLMITRGEELFHGIPFYLTSLFIACWIASSENLDDFTISRQVNRAVLTKFLVELKFMGEHLRTLARTIVSLLLIWLAIRGGETIITHRLQLSYNANFDFLVQKATDFRALGCGSSEVTFLYYPAEPLLYLFGDLQPVSKYYFLWPWVADKGMDEVIQRLSEPNLQAVVYVSAEGDVWGVPNKKTFAPLVAFLEEHFVRLDSNNYVSPALASQCAS